MCYPNMIFRWLVVLFVTVGFLTLLYPDSAVAQEQREVKTKPRPSRWDRQPHLTDKMVRSEQIIFKSTPQGDLKLHIWSPQTSSIDRPCIIFFFGGGWKGGSPQQFARQSEYFASRGIVAISAEYRVSGTHKTTPDICLEDAKSAIRWVRTHDKKLGIAPDKVIAAGGSAGGHLPAATAFVPDFDSKNDDPSVSAIPNALVLFNPALDLALLDRVITNGKGEDITEAISPTRFLHEEAPPVILFFGTDDPLAEHGEDYVAKAKELGLDTQLWWAADQGHGFFNNSPWLELTTQEVDHFLTRLGYLSGESSIAIPKGFPSLLRDRTLAR